MTNLKYYFEYEDSEYCYSLDFLIKKAKEEGKNEITLYEAIPDDSSEYYYCAFANDFSDASDCNKKNCEYYCSKSGRGVCKYRRHGSMHGKEVKFKIK